MSGFIDILAEGELEDGQMKGVKAESHLYLVAKVGGRYYVADGHCPHLRGNLTKGTLEGTVVTCPLHHSQFDLTDGSVVRWTDWSGAALTVASAVRHPRDLTVYEVEVVEGHVRVGPGRVSG